MTSNGHSSLQHANCRAIFGGRKTVLQPPFSVSGVLKINRLRLFPNAVDTEIFVRTRRREQEQIDKQPKRARSLNVTVVEGDKNI